MKTYSFTVDGKQYKLAGFTQEVKDEFMDPIRAELLMRAKRMQKKKLIDGATFIRLEKEALATSFHSYACAEEIQFQEGCKRLISLMLIPPDAATPEFLDRLMKEQKNTKSSFSVAMMMAKTDGFPKPLDGDEEATESNEDGSEQEGEQSDPPSLATAKPAS